MPGTVKLVKFDRQLVSYNKFLGQGSYGFVFDSCFQQNKHDIHSFAVKLFTHTKYAALEFHNFHCFLDAISQENHQKHKHTIQYLIPPKLEVVLSDDHLAIKYPWSGNKNWIFNAKNFSYIVDFLQLLHSSGFVHRDVRPSNFINFQGLIVPIDYGSITKKNVSSHAPYVGTEFFASNRVIKLLADGQNLIEFKFEDDLVSLVKMARAAVSPNRELFRYRLLSNKIGQELVDFWDEELNAGMWKKLIILAENQNYDKLKHFFYSFFLV
jgi:serine/threonine protein kinase